MCWASEIEVERTFGDAYFATASDLATQELRRGMQMQREILTEFLLTYILREVSSLHLPVALPKAVGLPTISNAGCPRLSPGEEAGKADDAELR